MCFRAAVKIHCFGAETPPTQPWQVAEQCEWTGSGFQIHVGGRVLIVTNAHVINDAFVVRVSCQENPRKQLAHVLSAAFDLDLALLEVEEQAFTQSLPVLPLQSTLPKLFSDVQTLGFSTGGDTVCVTKGVVSRIDAQLYAFSLSKGFSGSTASTSGKLLVVQIDAAINAGNSGGPAIDGDGAVIGVASSALESAQNVGYVIPTSVLCLFVDQFERTGDWKGICETGFSFRTMEGAALREFHEMGQNTGVLITGISPGSALAPFARAGDVLARIDDWEVANEGTVSVEENGSQQLPLEYIITSKPLNSCTRLTFLRAGMRRVEEVCFKPLTPLLPRYENFDAKPCYAIFGGLVFTRLTMPLFNSLLSSEEGLCLRYTAKLVSIAKRWRQENEQVIVLLRVLRHPVNDGIDEDGDLRVLERVNGVRISSLEDLVRRSLATLFPADREVGSFLRFGFSHSPEDCRPDAGEEVLRCNEVLHADSIILLQHGISYPVSSDLREVYEEESVAHKGLKCAPCCEDSKRRKRAVVQLPPAS